MIIEAICCKKLEPKMKVEITSWSSTSLKNFSLQTGSKHFLQLKPRAGFLKNVAPFHTHFQPQTIFKPHYEKLQFNVVLQENGEFPVSGIHHLVMKSIFLPRNIFHCFYCHLWLYQATFCYSFNTFIMWF